MPSLLRRGMAATGGFCVDDRRDSALILFAKREADVRRQCL
jgi:hypothetical protein